MTWKWLCWICLALLPLACGTAGAQAPAPAGQIRFDRDVRPILSDRCFTCHGPDAQRREADLRLDVPEGALAQLDDTMSVIRPGSLQQSAVFQRITEADDDMRMPPVDSKLSLTSQEIDIIKRWIQQGAIWTRHWSLEPIGNPPLPPVRDQAWVRNPIDRFVLARLEAEGLAPAPAAVRQRLIRRLSLDLTGLVPTPEEVDAFLSDQRADAYERLVDRLLGSPRFGERMAVDWLDVARYADTYGYQADVHRNVWPWRDWVIQAFNDNLPYDQFITWQLAGDLLPDASQQQILATTFNRLHRQTNEGGSVEEEFRCEYVADRVNTLGTAILGLTLECARCHDHKFDPVTQQDYYQLAALFDNIDESGLYSHFTDAVPTPTLLLTDHQLQQQIDALEAEIAQLENRQRSLRPHNDSADSAAFQAWLQSGPHDAAVPGLIGDYPLDDLQDNKLANRVPGGEPGTLIDEPEVVAAKVGQGLKLSGEDGARLPAGGGFTRNDPFTIALWLQTPDTKDRAVIFHRSRAWTDAGSRGYQLLIEQGCLSASLIHFWPGNAIRIRTTSQLATGRWVHVAVSYDGSSRALGLAIYVDGTQADCEVVRDKLRKNITGGGATTLDIGQRFRDRGFKLGQVDEIKVFDRCLAAVEVAQLYDGHALSDLLARQLGELSPDDRQQLWEYYLQTAAEGSRQLSEQLLQLRRSAASWWTR